MAYLLVYKGTSTELESPGHLQSHSPREFTPIGLLAPDDSITSRSSTFWGSPVEAVVVARPGLFGIDWILVPIVIEVILIYYGSGLP